ncbi:non-canonical purine NTP pyrophosphatase [Candidatus Microgenomates bacterium]|nr:non-canonical purine NTP pyrophosphatase [Candidatus Microgenomates bacterium]
MQLLIATHNPAKKKELTEGLLAVLPDCNITSLDDLGITRDPEETGKTFEENACLKATYYAAQSGLTTLADDGGILIDALNGEPGVLSKRWLGRAATDQELIDYCLKRMMGVPPEKRTARFTVVLCVVDPVTKNMTTVTESIEGFIAETSSKHWSPGFCYRAVFIVKQFNKYFDDLTQQEHEQINHRLIALRRLAKKLL